jgi:hypothetical protein
MRNLWVAEPLQASQRSVYSNNEFCICLGRVHISETRNKSWKCSRQKVACEWTTVASCKAVTPPPPFSKPHTTFHCKATITDERYNLADDTQWGCQSCVTSGPQFKCQTEINAFKMLHASKSRGSVMAVVHYSCYETNQVRVLALKLWWIREHLNNIVKLGSYLTENNASQFQRPTG